MGARHVVEQPAWLRSKQTTEAGESCNTSLKSTLANNYAYFYGWTGARDQDTGCTEDA